MQTPSSHGLLLRSFLLLTALFAAAVAPVDAQDRDPAGVIVSDRPGLGDGAWVVAPGVNQLELGATLEEVGGDGIGVASGLYRLGFERLELRVQLPSILLSVDPDGTEVGDLGLGLKLPLSFTEAWRWSLVAGTTLPTGTRGGSADDPAGSATLVGETALTEMIGFALNLGYGAAFEEFGDGTFSVIATPSVPLSGTMSGYAGYAGYFTRGVAPDRHWLEAGIAGTMNADTQWDLNGGWDAETESWFLGVGVSKRFR